MKKALVLFVLFALPVTIYIIFATAAHNFAHLPVLTENVYPLDNFETLNDDPISYDQGVTILCFFGDNIKGMRGNAYNLLEKAYKKNHIYTDFKIVVVAEDENQEEATQLINQLHDFTGVNMLKWKFAFGSKSEIQKLFNSMQTDLELDKNMSTPFVFIIDKEGNLRGRKDREETEESSFGYETRSIAALNNTLVDDISVLLAEYRLKLKSNERDITSEKHKKK